MATHTNAVEEAAELLRSRIRELDEERSKLESALSNLTGEKSGRRRGPGRPRGSRNRTSTSTSTPRRRRRRSGGTRAEQAVKLVTESPGITASEIAERMSIKPNYLYRVLSELQADGKVRKDGRTYHPTGGAPAAEPAEAEASS
ncbi:hypothetical protein HJD18_13125 [Thermoleophilia bacterium SCSIO 60948]|nr:hypothetical protein HJD18_13125 [Thermoleophilia bacterium SCSIO 60948]